MVLFVSIFHCSAIYSSVLEKCATETLPADRSLLVPDYILTININNYSIKARYTGW